MSRRKNKKPGSAARKAKAKAQANPLPSAPAQQPPTGDLTVSPQLAPMQPTYTWEDNPRPTKRQKTTSVVDAPQEALNSSEVSPQQDAHETVNGRATTTTLSTNHLPSELHHLQKTYDFTTMSIVSSSKMEQKVRNILLRTNKIDRSVKPGVVILTTKADVASKMVGIVEVAKREIQRKGGQWWQYTKLHPTTVELKQQKKPKRPDGGRTLREWADERAEKGEENESPQREGEEEDGPHQPREPTPAYVPGEEEEKDEDEDNGAFETMGRRQVMAYDENKSKIRAIAVLTIYLSQVSVPALKLSCNEQTNAQYSERAR